MITVDHDSNKINPNMAVYMTIGVPFLGVLLTRALLFGFYVKVEAHDFGKLTYGSIVHNKKMSL